MSMQTSESRQTSDPSTEIDELRAEIAETRAELADTVDQLSDKLDVRAQASRSLHQAAETAGAGAHTAAEKVRQALPDGAVAKLDQAAGGVQHLARSEPVQQHRKQLLIGAAGLLAVLLVLGRVRRGGSS